jgi:8-oxo-dGTP pyrophosphatase MutT (NUDIX family)
VPDLEVVALDRVDITLEPWSWPFASERRGDIDRHFARVQRERTGIWNGRILLVHRYAIDGKILRGACFETDYASFTAWHQWGFPDTGIYNTFAASALQTADGAFLVGQMAPDTAAAGKIYFPCGTPEPADVDNKGMLDLNDNLKRELLEETGIAIAELAAEPGWSLIRDGCYMALLKRLTSRQSAEDLRERIMSYIAQETRPEFVDIRILRSPADFDREMPRFVMTYLEHVWRR